MSNINPFNSSSLIDELFRGVNPGYFVKPLHGDTLPSQIKIDVSESQDNFVVHAEIPGVSKEHIHIDIDGDRISLHAQVSQIDSTSSEGKILRTERYYGDLSRSFRLSSEIDDERSKAKYENGILTLTLVKKQKKSGQRISIE